MMQAQRDCTRGPALDSVSASLYASAWSAGGKRPLHDDDAKAVVEAVGRGLRLPARVPVVALDGAQPRSAAAIVGSVMLRLAGGHLANVMIVTSTGSDELDSALTAAAAKAEQAGAFGHIREREPETKIMVGFTTLAAPVDPGEHDRSAPTAVAQVVLPRWPLAQGAALGAWNPPIHYPDKTPWSTDGGQIDMPHYLVDTVDVQYVVDEAGQISLPTIEVRSAHFGVTLDSVQNALPDIKYTPAVAGGCAAPQVVRQRFVFVGDDTNRVDRRVRPVATLHIHGDSVVGTPAVLVSNNRCTLVPARDTLPIQVMWGPAYKRDAYDFSVAMQAVRFVGSNARPADAVAICGPGFRQDQRAPEDPMYNAKPGYRPVLRSARVIADLQIDTLGHVVRNSISLVGASDPYAGRGMVKWLAGAKFDPATIGNKRVMSWMRLNYALDFAPSDWYQ